MGVHGRRVDPDSDPTRVDSAPVDRLGLPSRIVSGRVRYDSADTLNYGLDSMNFLSLLFPSSPPLFSVDPLYVPEYLQDFRTKRPSARFTEVLLISWYICFRIPFSPFPFALEPFQFYLGPFYSPYLFYFILIEFFSYLSVVNCYFL